MFYKTMPFIYSMPYLNDKDSNNLKGNLYRLYTYLGLLAKSFRHFLLLKLLT